MKYSKIKWPALASGLLFTVQAQAELTANLALTSDYLVDGISQTDNAPALQGGVDWSAESGLYLGSWGSMVDFNADSKLETDWYGGYRFDSDKVSFDAGIAFYKYRDGILYDLHSLTLIYLEYPANCPPEGYAYIY